MTNKLKQAIDQLNIDYCNEIWKPIKGYEGLYEVSNMGRIKSVEKYITKSNGVKEHRRAKLLSPRNICGYLIVDLSKTGEKPKHSRIHRLVAEAFIDNPENKPYINHLNENKFDNRASNLEYSTSKENCNYGTCIERRTASRASHRNSVVLCVETGKIYESCAAAGRDLNLSRAVINFCCNGKLETTGGYHWKYIDKTSLEASNVSVVNVKIV